MRSAPSTTDGWRGLPGRDWSEYDILAKVDHLAVEGFLGDHVLVGFDGRAGSVEIARLVADLLADRNIDRTLATGPAPTPAVGAIVNAHLDFSAGIIVTASHNPAGYIGVKVRDDAGQGVQWPQPPAGARVSLPPLAAHRHLDVAVHYADNTGRALAKAAAGFGTPIVVDAAHGAVGAVAPYLDGIYWRRDRILPFFGGTTPDPVLRPQSDGLARAALRSAPLAGLVAMVDGDGDRLVLFTEKSGCITSAEQAAALLHAGLPAHRIITTTVAPSIITTTAERLDRGAVIRTPVGFKHIVDAFREDPGNVLGVEPNGALAWTSDPSGYFERDSLAALTTILTQLSSLEELDDTIAELRTHHPYQQTIVTAPPADDPISALRSILTGWDTETIGDTTVFRYGAHGRIAARASGTEPGVRLYIEADPATAERVIAETNAR